MKRTVRRSSVTILGMLAALAMLAPAASAQQGGGHGAHGAKKGSSGGQMGGMRGGHGAMLGHVPMAILHQQEALGLSEQQVSRVEALQDSVMALHERAMAAMQEARGGIEGAFGEDGIDVEAYRRAVRAAADRRVEARVRAAEIASGALDVLDDSQRERFLYAIHLMHRMHGGKGDGHGMMKGHGSMDGQCPMMEGGRGQGARRQS